MPLHVYATKVGLPPLDPDVRVHAHRTRADDGFAAHLDGFGRFVVEQAGEEISPLRVAVLQHIARVRHHLSVEVPSARLEAFAAWLADANAVCLSPDGAVRDPEGRMLVDAEGREAELGARVPHPSDARMAKAYNESQLRSLGVESLPPLPPGPGAEEVELRAPGEIAARTWALQEKLRALDEPAPELVDAVAVFEWATSVVSLLPLPLQPADAAETLARFDRLDRAAFVAEPDVRPASEILAQFDMHERLLWLVRAAADQGEGAPAPGGVDRHAVAVRHAALGWLAQIDDG